MSNRTTAIAAVLFGCVSIISITSPLNAAPDASESAAKPADDCLSAPKGATPAGAHWYYRSEKGTKRKCWYLGDAAATKAKKAASSEPASSTAAPSDAEGADIPPPTQIAPIAKNETPKKPIQKSVANARAELTTGTDEELSLAETTWPPLPGPSDTDAARSDNQIAAIQPAGEAANQQGWNVATRWPEPSAVASVSDQSSTSLQQPDQPAPALTAERLAAAAATQSAAPQAAVASTQPPQPATVADSEGLSLRVMLSVLVCLLAVAAILGPMLLKFFRPKPRQERLAGHRRSLWDPVDNDDVTLVQDNPTPIPARRPARVLDEPLLMDEPRRLNDATDEIEALLARVSKRSAA